MLPCSGFNPLPSPKQGETPRHGRHARIRQLFQSAPLTEARGDPGALPVAICPIGVSIRSPHRSKGRQGLRAQTAQTAQFQSAPLTEARGDSAASCESVKSTTVSIRSPHRSKGRLIVAGRLIGLGMVSIRSPHRSKGRRREITISVWKLTCFNPLPSPKQGETIKSRNVHTATRAFQSAPLTEARGDRRFFSDSDPAQTVSIRSPHRSKGRHENAKATRNMRNAFVSIRSPHRSKGRRNLLYLLLMRTCRFNPLPSPKQGETDIPRSKTRWRLVSIRSPHRSKGRLVRT